MAFNRILTVKVGFENSGVLISDLNIDFQIERSIDFSVNTAQLKIYNPSVDTQEKFLKKGASIVVSAGYDDEGSGGIYVGQITESVKYKEGSNRIVDITAGSIQNANRDLAYVTVSLSYKRDTAVVTPLKDIATALGLANYGFEIAKSIKLSNGFSYAGSAKTALARCKDILNANGMDLFIDNTTIVVFKRNTADTRFKVVYLTPDTGLIGTAKITDSSKAGNIEEEFPLRVSFKSLLNPQLNPNGVVVIDKSTVTGTFIIEKISFSGNNYGGAFIAAGEGVA